MLTAIKTNQAYLGSNRTNPFHYQQFRLNQVTIYCNGQPIVGSPIATTFNHRIYYNTADALDFLEKNGHGIKLSDYANHFIMAFDLTSTQEASHDFLHPELTDCSISVDLQFADALANNIEINLFGGKSAAICITSHQKVTKDALVTFPENG